MAIFFLLLVPRYSTKLEAHGNKASNFAITKLSENPSSIFHKIIYLHGPLEKVGNVALVFILFIILPYLFPRLSIKAAALICCMLSACVESMQVFIPGRVSSLVDFLTNVIGVGSAFILVTRFPIISTWTKGEIPKVDS